MNADVKNAKVAGLLYLIYIVVHICGDVIGRAKILVFGDAAATASNILSSPARFRIGYVTDLISAVLFLVTAWALYRLLKPVNSNVALLFLLLNLTGVAIRCVSDLFLPASQLILSGAEFTRVWPADQLRALAMTMLYLYKNGSMIAEILFGAWVLPLGYCVWKSGFLPRVLGLVLMTHFVTWMSTSLLFFLLPTFKAITYVSWPLGFVAEFGLALWLILKGVSSTR